MNYRIFGGFLILLGIVIFVSVLYHNSNKRQEAIVFTPKFMLDSLWQTYKKSYWEEATGRTIDRQRSNITTSEGQSYTMLRAVWQDDKEVFDKTWEWTQTYLKRPDDRLFAWLYGQNEDGSYGILEAQGGHNSASDADTDIAMALIFASVRWQDPAYMQDALGLLEHIWELQVVEINGTPYLAANNVEKMSGSSTVIINPSYLAPYAYRIFAQVDPERDWQALISSSYSVLEKSSQDILDKRSSRGLTPDWVAIHRTTGALVAPDSQFLTTNYSYDALRVPWRVAVDWQWNKEPRAKKFLEKFEFLGLEWQTYQSLVSSYSHDGQRLDSNEVPAMYGGSIGYFLVVNPSQAEEVYKTKLERLYSPDIQSWKTALSYYDDNWAWFGLALYTDNLPNIFQEAQR